jgi:hypothetical protein
MEAGELGDVLLYIGAVVVIGWGIGHVAATRSAVSGFGDLSRDNRLTITMEWIAEALALCFLGVLIVLVTVTAGSGNPVSVTIYRACGGMLLVLAALHAATGARTSVVPMKLCPYILTTSAVLIIVGSWI